MVAIMLEADRRDERPSRVELEALLPVVRHLHDRLRDAVVAACERQEVGQLSAVAQEGEGDTLYAVDAVNEAALFEEFAAIAAEAPLVLVAEGLSGGSRVLPLGADESQARWRVIVDPIDGTRCLMYQKRSAWILTGVAPNRGPDTSLRDIELAVQTEIPLVKQHLCDQLWCLRGRGAFAERYHRLTGQRSAIQPSPSKARSIAHGYAMISRFFPGVRDELAAIDEEVVRGAVGPPQPGKTHVFEDQYTSSGGQLHELLAGRDRFVADLRPLMRALHEERGLPFGICCHPYDVCTLRIAEELGVIVTDPAGRPLDAPLDVHSDVAWVGYANQFIRDQVEPALQRALRSRNLL
jgi:fructose-1,6-bisphosphatase/inositol monophosphatase family enzyme